jgi:hypothetical protein
MTKRSKRIKISKKTVKSKGKDIDVYTVIRKKPKPLKMIQKSSIKEKKFLFGSYGMVKRFSKRGNFIKDNLHDRWYRIDRETKKRYWVVVES